MKAVTFETGEIDMTSTLTRGALIATMDQHLGRPDSLWTKDRYGDYLRHHNGLVIRLHIKDLVVRFEVKTPYGEWVRHRSAYFKDVRFDDHMFDGKAAPAVFIGKTPLWLTEPQPISV